MNYLIQSLFLFFSMSLFAQGTISDTLVIKNGDILLPGTLSYPNIPEKQPLVIFVHGSGNIDRDGNQAGVNIRANYIKILADSLNRHGIAFFRYDKRTAVPENRKSILQHIVYEDLVEDARKVIAHFNNDKRFNEIILIGHSQGSLTAMLAVNKAVDKYISLAGPGEAFDKVVVRQLAAQHKELSETAKRYFEELVETDTIREVHPLLAALFAPQNHKFLKSYAAYNPVEALKKIAIPTLIINGEADLQVRVEDARLLHQAKPGAELLVIPKMNHLLKEVNTLQENQQSYYSENFPLSSMLVKAVTRFIKS